MGGFGGFTRRSCKTSCGIAGAHETMTRLASQGLEMEQGASFPAELAHWLLAGYTHCYSDRHRNPFLVVVSFTSGI